MRLSLCTKQFFNYQSFCLSEWCQALCSLHLIGMIEIGSDIPIQLFMNTPKIPAANIVRAARTKSVNRIPLAQTQNSHILFLSQRHALHVGILCTFAVRCRPGKAFYHHSGTHYVPSARLGWVSDLSSLWRLVVDLWGLQWVI